MHVTDKLEVELEGGKTQRLRPKDVVLLHPGPLQGLSELTPQAGEVESAWELLMGERTTLAELAELAYGSYTPSAAWAAWQVVADGLHFQGTPEEIVARPREEVERERSARERRAAEALQWQQFMERLHAGKVLPEDALNLKEVEALALGKGTRSRLMQKLDLAETPENAHRLLLRAGYWPEHLNPYPQRLRAPVEAPTIALPPLPEEDRVDLTHLTAFAIDDEGNQDPDDALSLEGSLGGGRLWVHVADVAALVSPDSPADLEARARAATLYLPESTRPMLPPEALASLGLGLEEVSPALSIGMDLDTAGAIAHVEVVRSWIRAQRVTYAETETTIAHEPFAGLWRIAQALRERRRANGAALMEFPEVVVRVRDGEVAIRSLPSLRSRTLVTEAMLMAGEAAARFALERNIPFPFATQPAPEVREQPETLAAMHAYRKKLKRRQMKSTAEPHTGLGLPVYAQVTSPLRRYLDLVAHQQLRAHLRGEPLLDASQLLTRVGASEAAAATIRRAERLSNRHWTLVYLLHHPEWRGEGVLVERRGQLGTVLIPPLGLEVQVHVSGNPPLDTRVPLVLKGVDLPELGVHFQMDVRG
jgi:exoribonuclease-2